MAFIDRPDFKIEVLKDDWRLSPYEAKRRATGSGKLKKCNDCGKKKVEFSQAIRWGKRAFCSECRRRHRDMKN